MAAAAAVPVALKVTEVSPVELAVSCVRAGAGAELPAADGRDRRSRSSSRCRRSASRRPSRSANVTETPETGLPCVSVTSTDGAVATFVFTVARLALADVDGIEPAVPATPVAVKVTGLPARPPEVAVSVFAPAVCRASTSRRWRRRSRSWCVVPVAEPPPEATANVTATPETGLPRCPSTRTDGAVETFVSTVALWPLPPLSGDGRSGGGVPVALNVTGLPVEAGRRSR